MLNASMYSINDVRELENKPPIPGGDVHLKPMNMEAIAAPEVETGNGAVLGPFAAYTVEKKLAKDPSRFGRGAIKSSGRS